MKRSPVFLFLIFAVAACSSPKTNPQTGNPKESSDIAQLSSPDTENYDKSKVSVDSVKTVEQGLLIAGTLPDGCSKLHKASHTIQDDTLNITLSAWKPADKMCTQVLSPFTYIYEKFSKQEISNAAVIIVNRREFEIKQQ